MNWLYDWWRPWYAKYCSKFLSILKIKDRLVHVKEKKSNWFEWSLRVGDMPYNFTFSLPSIMLCTFQAHNRALLNFLEGEWSYSVWLSMHVMWIFKSRNIFSVVIIILIKHHLPKCFSILKMLKEEMFLVFCYFGVGNILVYKLIKRRTAGWLTYSKKFGITLM